MIFDRCIRRLRAAYALSFAMASGTRPRAADLNATGLECWPKRPREGGSAG